MATSPLPLPPTPTPLSPLGFGASSMADWLNLDQAGESTEAESSTDTSYLFQDKLPTFDYGGNADFDFDALLQSAGLSNVLPDNGMATDFTLDPSTIMGFAPMIDQADIASPLTFSPSSTASVNNHSSDIHVSDSGTPESEATAPHYDQLQQLQQAIEAGASSDVVPQTIAPLQQQPAFAAPAPSQVQAKPAPVAAAPKPAFIPVTAIQEESDEGDAMDDVSAFGDHSGGATKKRQAHPHALVDVPDWADKPSAEEYKKLSSKEKRQLRNKISARNFRHRRKEHITTLEQQVAQRDDVIETLRSDLSTVRSENKELRTEVDLLKTKWSDLMKKIEQMSGAGTVTASAASASSAASAAASGSGPVPTSPRPRPAPVRGSVIPKPNLFKDIGSHSMKAFNGAGGMAGGNVGVHTTLIPDVPVDPYARAPRNMNPALNNLTSAQRTQFDKGLFTQHLRGSLNSPGSAPTDDFMASNPYLLSPQALLEMKRQMYGKVAHNAPAFLAAAANGDGSKLPEGFKPAFFLDPNSAAAAPSSGDTVAPSARKVSVDASEDLSSEALSALLDQEAATEAEREDKRLAYVASLAASTLLTRMTNIFLDAFRGGALAAVDGVSSGVSSESLVGAMVPFAGSVAVDSDDRLDTAKVNAVLEGRSQLQVTEKAPPPYSFATGPSASVAQSTSTTPLASSSTSLNNSGPTASSSSSSTAATITPNFDAAIESLGLQLRNMNVEAPAALAGSNNRSGGGDAARSTYPSMVTLMGESTIRRCAMSAWAGRREEEARRLRPSSPTSSQ